MVNRVQGNNLHFRVFLIAVFVISITISVAALTKMPYSSDSNDISGAVTAQAKPIKICSDGTPYGVCSSKKPKYCDNGNLVESCTKCNCNLTSSKSIWQVWYPPSPQQQSAQPSTQQSPYRGVPFTIPGIIQAEDFDNGGEGIDYHDVSVLNHGGQYRQTGVDVEASDDSVRGYNIGWTKTGEWLEYSVNVQSSGTYTLNARIASLGVGGSFHVEFNGVDKTGQIPVPDTGGWYNWRTVLRTVQLNAGRQIMRVVFDSTGPSGDSTNLNYIDIQAVPSLVCAGMFYPSGVWQRSWYYLNGSCLGNGPDEAVEKFDNNWGWGVLAYGRADSVKLISSRTITFDAGTYNFTIGSDDGSRLYIDEQLVVDNWAVQPYTEESAAMSFAAAGSHRVRIEFYENLEVSRFSFDYNKITPAVSGTWQPTGFGGGGNVGVVEVDTKNTNVLWAGIDIGGPYKSTNKGDKWSLANKGYGDDNVISIAIDPVDTNKVYGLGCGGIYMTVDGGQNWNKISNEIIYGWNFNPCWYWNRLIAINPKNTKEIFVGSAKRIDGGTYISGGGLWKGTEDASGSFSWQHLNSFSTSGAGDLDLSNVIIDPSNPQNIYAGVRGGAAKFSKDGGTRWTDLGIWDISSFAIYPKDTRIIYASTPSGRIYKSTDGGYNWADKSISNSGYTISGTKTSSLAIDPNNQNNLYLGMRNWYSGWDKSEIFKTTNGGDSWRNINKKLGQGFDKAGNPWDDIYMDSITDVEMVAVDPNDFNTVYLATFWGMVKSTDGGNNWKAISNGLQITGANPLLDPRDPNKIYVTGGDATLFFSDDYGSTWRHIVVDRANFGQSWAIAAANTSPTTIYYSSETDSWDGKNKSYPVIIRKSTDYGATWAKTQSGLPNVDRNSNPYPYDGGVVKIIVHPTSTNTVFAAIKGRGIYKTTNEGSQWSLVLAGYPNSLEMAPSNPNVLYTTGYNWAYKSTNNGITWTAITPRNSDNGLNEGTYAIAVHPTDQNTLYIGTQRYLIKSTDGGSTWKKVLSPNTGGEYNYFIQAIEIDKTNPDRVFVGITGYRPRQGLGVYVSEDGGNTWKEMNRGLEGKWLQYLRYDLRQKTLFAGTHTGLFKIRI